MAMWIPENLKANRGPIATSFQIENDDLTEASISGISALELPYEAEEIREVIKNLKDKPVLPVVTFQLQKQDGEHRISVEKFEVPDGLDITREHLLAWIGSRTDGDKEKIQFELASILSRWLWRTLDWNAKKDLVSELHYFRMNGTSGFYNRSTEDLLNAIFEEEAIIEFQHEAFQEELMPAPFDLELMISHDKELWLGEE